MAPRDVKKNPKKKEEEAKSKLRKPLTKPESKFNAPPKRDLLSSDLAQDDEPEFPRGGGSLLSREEKAEARAEAEAEFEVDHGLKRKGGEIKKRKKMKLVRGKRCIAAEDEWGSLFGQGIAGKLPKLTNTITWKNISAGMKLWGVVMEVNLKDIEVSLPGGLRGFVHAEDASDVLQKDCDKMPHSIPKTVNVGQLVSCVVMKVDDDKGDEKVRKRIKLSLRLSVLYKGLTLDAVQDGMVLIAEVKSAEDHGYILHFGVPSFSGFLSKSDNDDIQIYKGQLLHCVVKSVDKVRAVVYATSSPDLVSKYATKDLKGLSIDFLVPGMLVNAYVHSKLENGIMLSFLTYFTGTVDVFNLQSSFPTDNWKDEYTPHKKVNARILFVDPSTRAVGLTLNPHLVLQHKPPTMHVKPGEIYENARVLRIDERFGLLLSITSSPEHTPAYVHRIDASDEDVLKLKKKFKEGDYARLRVQGIRQLEGLVIGTLKASAFDRSVFTHSDVKPGLLAKAQVITVGPFGAIVQFASGVKALCPCRHMSEFERVKPAKKFKVGAELLFRVLGCKSKRITVTHKKTLIKSKLAILASHVDATEGLLTHGWITKIEKHGCYVRFYNGVQGFAPRSELGLDPGSEPNTCYHVEQTVKCRITRSGATSRIINISFVIFPKRNSDADVRLGSIVSGVVEKLTPAVVIVNVKNFPHLRGLISYEHLADHQGQIASMKSLLRPEFEFDQLVVLDINGGSLILSAKYSLVHYAEDIPSNITHVQPFSVVHGYVCNIIETGCFVRFLGRLTGFSLKIRTTDHKVACLSNAYYIGQSVRSHIVKVDPENSKIKLAMKQSLCFSTDASYIQSYFHVENKISALQTLEGKHADLSWVKAFNIGCIYMGEVQEIKEFGIVVGFEKYPDTVGFISRHQLGGVNLEKGSVIRAFVLDASKSESLVDLSLKPELINSVNAEKSDKIPHISKKKRRRTSSSNLEVRQTVNAVVELVKENYLVLSLPEHDYAVGYASIFDYNTEMLPHRQFLNGQSLLVTVESLPDADPNGRLLLLLKALNELTGSSLSKRAKKMSNYIVGSLVEAEIVDIKSLELHVKFGAGFIGKIHITEVEDSSHPSENPFANFRLGQLIKARIIAKVPQKGKNNHFFNWMLSVKPSVLTGNMESDEATVKIDKVSAGSIVKGYVVKVDSEWVQVSVSRHLMANIFILDSSPEPNELRDFQKRFSVGQAVSGRVVSVNKEKKAVRLSLRLNSPLWKPPLEITTIKNDEDSTEMYLIENGDVIGGKVKKILPNAGGIFVQIGLRLFGKVHYTEITDSWVSEPTSGYEEGQFVKCKVLEISRSLSGFVHADLSLRRSLVDSLDPLNVNIQSFIERDLSCVRFEKIEDLHPNIEVHGYVKNVTSKGCFIMLSRKLDARILLSNLSDGFVENPDKDFPIGKGVHGRVLTVDLASKRVDITLKEKNESHLPKPDVSSFSNLHVGGIVSGHVRRVETFGLFIAIDGTSLVGLCHISEISDDNIDHIETKYRAGERVEAKVLKIDEERQRIRLGMKHSYLKGADNAAMGGMSPAKQEDLLCIKYLTEEEDDSATAILSQAESRAFVPPLQVSLEDFENSKMESDSNGIQSDNKRIMTVDNRRDRHVKKKEKQERELEIRESEERRLQNDTPKTVDDFEILVRCSPNSSFLWIKYMEFVLSLADVEKARSIAERALKTVTFQEEGERLNIWVAYLNLENDYGNSPEEDVERVFKTAAQTCDPKKLHLALLALYQRTEQHAQADALLDKMTKKFKKSCKVWLNRVQYSLNHKEDGVQSVINRAVLSLPANKHIKFISHTAILEFKCGMPEMGRPLFEGILREHPKRTDIWSVYLDQEIRLGDNEVIRSLFERATCLSLPAKKMKFLFKKYHSFEESLGDKDRMEYVKSKALQYLESSN